MANRRKFIKAMQNLKKFGQAIYDYPLSALTTFKIGGVARAVVYVHQEDNLLELISYLERIGCSYFILGKGSNVLAPDKGYDGVIIKWTSADYTWETKGNHVILNVGAGMKIAKLLNLCLQRGWEGLSFLAGIPGTIGGAVAVNAGAFSKSIGEKVRRIKLFLPSKKVEWLDWDQTRYAYRFADIPSGGIVLRAELKLKPSYPAVVQAQIKGFFLHKKQTQPLFLPSAGCIFKNPPQERAGFLIDKAGLKGKRIGGACISPKHANFIVNTGQAKAADVLALMEFVQEKIEKETGIFLEPEIKFIQ